MLNLQLHRNIYLFCDDVQVKFFTCFVFICNTFWSVRGERVVSVSCLVYILRCSCRMSLARRGRKQATAPEDFEFHISYL